MTTESAPEGLSPYCPAYSQAIEILGRRWTGAIVRGLLTGATRFSELADRIPGISDRLLSERLKELEAEGIIERKVLPSTPVRIEYFLTEKGSALGSVVRAVNDWASDWAAGPAAVSATAPAQAH